MNEGEPSLAARRAPLELSAEEFAAIGHRLVDQVAGLLATMRERPLTSAETPAEIRGHLGAAAALPEEGAPAGALVEEATRLLFEHSLFNGHPRFFGYITAGAAPISVLGDLLASAVNPNVGAWALSPMASEIEGQTVRWIAELIGYPTDGDGVLVSGGNLANMLGFWAARAAKAPWNVRESGMLGGGARRLLVYGSAGMHTWIQKAADLSGLGTDSVRWVETDERGRVDVQALRARIAEDVEAGHHPFLVVGTGGSVGTGAVDPLPRLRDVCDEHDLWLHVDGAYGALAAAAPNAPDDLRGLSLADSVAVDPHKWLYVPLEAGCTLVRDPEALLRAFSYHPTYFAFDEQEVNYHERGIQNSRGFRALKVWLALRQVGRAGYARMIADDIALAERFYGIAERHTRLEALTHGLSITTFRFVPEDLAARAKEPDVAEYLNDLNRAVQARIEKSGDGFVSNAVLGEVYALRMCIVNFRTRSDDLDRLAELTDESGRMLDAEMRPQGL
jgi:aromatic-L-amino-acid/L-tryptophan decarboxylase